MICHGSRAYIHSRSQITTEQLAACLKLHANSPHHIYIVCRRCLFPANVFTFVFSATSCLSSAERSDHVICFSQSLFPVIASVYLRHLNRSIASPYICAVIKNENMKTKTLFFALLVAVSTTAFGFSNDEPALTVVSSKGSEVFKVIYK